MSLLTDLVSYWKLDEASGNALDAHGSNTLTDGNTVGAATGKINGGRDFDRGNAEFFNINSALINTLPIGISLWFRPESVNVNQNLIGAGIIGSANFAWGLAVSATAKYYFYAANGSGTFITLNGTTSLVNGNWYHLAFNWRTATDYQIYLNGSSEGTGSTSRSPGGSQNRFSLGRYAGDTGGDEADGVMDEVGIWARELTSGDITQLYNSGNGLPYSSFGGGGTVDRVSPVIRNILGSAA